MNDPLLGGAVDDSVNVVLTIDSVNEQPVAITHSNINKLEDAADFSVDLTGHFQDPDIGDTLAISIVGNTDPTLMDGLSYNASTQQLAVSLAANQHGASAITLQAVDSGGLSVDMTFTIFVASVNDTVVAPSPTYKTTETSIIGDVLPWTSDVDGEVLTAVLLAGPAHGTFSFNADGSFSYDAESGFSGDDSFTFAIDDGVTLSNAATVTLTIDNVAPPPPPASDDDGGDEEETESKNENEEDASSDSEELVQVSGQDVRQQTDLASSGIRGLRTALSQTKTTSESVDSVFVTDDASERSFVARGRIVSQATTRIESVADAIGPLRHSVTEASSTVNALAFLAEPSHLWEELGRVSGVDTIGSPARDSCSWISRIGCIGV